MVGILSSTAALQTDDVADLLMTHLQLLSAVDAIAAKAAAEPETKSIGLQLKLAAGLARTKRRKVDVL